MKIIKVILIVILSVITFFFLVVLRLYAIKIYDVNVQQAHMKRLISHYESDAFQPVDEHDFFDFNIDPNLRLNEIQMLATHNSYKKTGSDIGRFFVGLGDSFEEARALRYGYHTLTQQLEFGVRSMELDVRLRKDQFMLTHVPLVDNSSVAPIFSDALHEIKLFSENHPNHMPIILLIEVKDDWMILDHALQKIESAQLEKLNTIIKETLGDQLFQPKDMIESGKTLKDTIQTTGWPTLQHMLGKVMVVLHPSHFVVPYVALDPTLDTLSMFPGVYANQIDRDYASFIVHNEVNRDAIQALVDQQFIVRTRIDSQLIFNATDYDQAILSGAQILTSDFTIGRKDIKQDDIIYLPNGKMLMLRSTS